VTTRPRQCAALPASGPILSPRDPAMAAGYYGPRRHFRPDRFAGPIRRMGGPAVPAVYPDSGVAHAERPYVA